MEQILTGLGAEVIGTQMVPAPDPAASGLAAVFVMIGVVSSIVFVGLRLRPYVPFRSRTPESIAFLTSLLALYFGIFSIVLSVLAPIQTDEIGGYVVCVDEGTDLTAIGKQFEIVDTEDYPILTVKAKNKE